MALDTDTFDSLKKEYQFKSGTENWHPVIIDGKEISDAYVGISGTVIYTPGKQILPGTKLTDNEYSKYALPTKLNTSCLLEIVLNGQTLPVHRIVAETFLELCFIYTPEEILEKPERAKSTLEELLKNNTQKGWVIHHKDNNANNNSVPNLVWLTEEDHTKTHPNKTFLIKNKKLCKSHI